MFVISLTRLISYLSLISLINAHARLKSPKPLAAAPENPSGNYYNEPLSANGNQFPCKGLHKQADVDKTPTEVWHAGRMARFEILGHNSTGEGNLAAHSGGSCQASLSFDNGITWKVIHSYHGGCPRDARLGSNIAGKDQVFFFTVPAETKAGRALFSWTWIGVTGNRNEFFQNCASVMITGQGTTTLDHLPDMYIGEMTIPGHIKSNECRSVEGTSVTYPHPGPAVTVAKISNIPFRQATGGNCFAKKI